MAGQEFQYIQDILKEFYAPAIVNLVYKKAPLWAQIEKKVTGMSGKRVYIPVQTAFTEAVGSRVANNYALPTAQKNSYDSAYIYMKRFYGRIQVDGFSIESSQGKGGWIDILAGETKGVANAFAMEMDRQSLGRGEAVLGHVGTGGCISTHIIQVDNPHGIVGDTAAEKYFRVGQVVDIYDASDSFATKLVDSLTIDEVDTTNHYIHLSNTTGVFFGCGWRLHLQEDSFSATAANIGDMMGIDGIISASDYPLTADFEGIDRDAQSLWQSHVDSTSQVISEDVIQGELEAISKQTDGEPVDLILTTYALKNKLKNIVQADRVVDSVNLEAGYKGLKFYGGEFGEVPIMVHKNCPTGYMYFIAKPHIKFYTLKKLTWDNKGGGIVKPVSGYDAYESWFKLYANLGTDCPNAMGNSLA
ncbi:MAG: phage major capsid protein [Marinilabiliales bacterium]|nr:phage major capsid protein [Marinilabiliales bacterium]